MVWYWSPNWLPRVLEPICILTSGMRWCMWTNGFLCFLRLFWDSQILFFFSANVHTSHGKIKASTYGQDRSLRGRSAESLKRGSEDLACLTLSGSVSLCVTTDHYFRLALLYIYILVLKKYPWEYISIEIIVASKEYWPSVSHISLHLGIKRHQKCVLSKRKLLSSWLHIDEV